MKISVEKLNEWKLLLEERKQRGMKVDEFCKEKNITVPQFYYYHKQVNKTQNPNNKYHDNAAVKPIQIVSTPSKDMVIRIILPNNIQCVLPRDMALTEIRGILEVIMTC